MKEVISVCQIESFMSAVLNKSSERSARPPLTKALDERSIQGVRGEEKRNSREKSIFALPSAIPSTRVITMMILLRTDLEAIHELTRHALLAVLFRPLAQGRHRSSWDRKRFEWSSIASRCIFSLALPIRTCRSNQIISENGRCLERSSDRDL